MDEAWSNFQARLSRAPTQCVRYCHTDGADPGREQKPLWPSVCNLPSSVPKCGLCGKDRRFEFQVLPQVLYYAGVDSGLPDDLDFTTIAVYTCACSVRSYAEEFAWTT